MTLMKRSVNLFLVFLIVLAVSVIGGLTVYYQDNFRSLSDDYITTDANLTVCHQTLKATQDELALTKAAVSANQQDVDKTVQLFEEKKTELEGVQETLEETQQQVKSLQNTVSLKDKQISQLNTQIGQLNIQISALNAEIEDLEEELDNACP